MIIFNEIEKLNYFAGENDDVDSNFNALEVNQEKILKMIVRLQIFNIFIFLGRSI
jgi:hypothetical protein